MIKRFISLLRFPFLSHIHVILCAILPVCHLKYPYSYFYSHFCFLVFVVFQSVWWCLLPYYYYYCSGEGKIKQAILLIKKAVHLTAPNAQLFLTLGNLLAQNNQMDEAQKFFEAAISMKPNYADAYNHYGSFFQQKGKFFIIVMFLLFFFFKSFFNIISDDFYLCPRVLLVDWF